MSAETPFFQLVKAFTVEKLPFVEIPGLACYTKWVEAASNASRAV